MIEFDDAECYQLFLAVDDRVRQLQPSELLALRERLLPFYKARHAKRIGAQVSTSTEVER